MSSADNLCKQFEHARPYLDLNCLHFLFYFVSVFFFFFFFFLKKSSADDKKHENFLSMQIVGVIWVKCSLAQQSQRIIGDKCTQASGVRPYKDI